MQKKSEKKDIKHYIVLKIIIYLKKKVYEYHFVLLVTYKHLSEKFSNEIIIFH